MNQTVSLALRAAGTQLLALYYPSAIAAPVDRARSSQEPSVLGLEVVWSILIVLIWRLRFLDLPAIGVLG